MQQSHNRRLKIIIALPILLMVAAVSYSQDDSDIVMDTDKIAEFPGGEKARIRYLNDHLQCPFISILNRVQGKVFVTFTIDTLGKVGDVDILRGLDIGCDLAVIEVIKNMPVWIPASKGGKAVKIKMNMPVEFNCQSYGLSILEHYEKPLRKPYSYMLYRDFKKSVKLFDKVILKYPELADAYVYRGLSLVVQEDTIKACKDWTIASSLGSDLATEIFKTFCK